MPSVFRPLPLIALLTLFLAACDSGDSADGGLVLDGTFRGNGESQIATGADPEPAQVLVAVTFDEATVGDLDADVSVTVTAFGGMPETYTGTVDGTLTDADALSLNGLLTRGSLEFLFRLDGNATATRIEGNMTGNLTVSNIALAR